MTVSSALIHEFVATAPPFFDDEGDQMLGFYYQFTDSNGAPVRGLVGPYRYRADAEGAARRAFARRDF